METASENNSPDEVSDNLRRVYLILQKLQSMGYRCHFQLCGKQLKCVETNQEYPHLNFHVDEIYRIDGGILESKGFSIFALRHRSDDLRGIFVAI